MCPLLGPPPLGMTARFCIVEDCGGRSSARDSDSPVGLWPPKAVALPDEEPMMSYRKYLLIRIRIKLQFKYRVTIQIVQNLPLTFI